LEDEDSSGGVGSVFSMVLHGENVGGPTQYALVLLLARAQYHRDRTQEKGPLFKVKQNKKGEGGGMMRAMYICVLWVFPFNGAGSSPSRKRLARPGGMMIVDKGGRV
jgi:hypothetical protein